jgi:hypothetical protein
MHAYFDCFSGISGDMTLAAFIDLGVPVSFLKESISRVIPEKDFQLEVNSVSRKGINAVNVVVSEREGTASRNYSEIKSILQKNSLPERVRNISLEIFSRIAEAEAKIHGCPVEKVHFHEVGGVDAIVDVVGTAFCVDYLELSSISASKISLGKGFTKCSHGTLPVPAPATLEILKGVSVLGTGIQNELVTPTGAAIIATLASEFHDFPDMKIHKIGYGAGKRDLEEIPNVLRIVTGIKVGEELKNEAEKVVLVETCIDDMNSEIFGFLMERLFQDGALDVYWLPIYMKKNRPGTMVQVVCHESIREKVVSRILTETTTSGVRYFRADRRILQRQSVEVETRFGKLQAKKITKPDGSTVIVPEYEVCRKIALEKNIPVKSVYDAVEAGSSIK